MPSNNKEQGPDERVHSETWWKIKTGWTNEEYLERKNTLLARVREEWPHKKAPPTDGDLLDAIESVVATFDDRIWCLPGEKDRTLIFAEQLRLYKKWASHIYNQSRRMPVEEVFKISPRTTDRPFPLLSNTARSPVPGSDSASLMTSDVVEPVFQASTTKFAVPETHKTPCMARPVFDWADVEVYVDSRIDGSIEHLIPMTLLGADDPNKQYRWSAFGFDKLMEYLEQTEGRYYCMCDIDVYWIVGSEWMTIENDAEYKITLKRFMEAPTKNNTIEILIEKRKKDGTPAPKLYPIKKAGSLKRKAPPA